MSNTLSVPLEREALAILLQNPGANLCRELSEADFTKPRDLIFSAALALDSINRLSEALLLEQLTAAGQIAADAGIADEIRHLFANAAVPPAALFPQVVRELQGYTQRRRACRYAFEIERAATDASRPFALPEPPRELHENTAPRFLEFRTPDELADWETPEGFNLAGDAHLVRGGLSVIAGVPGCGKSRTLAGLAVAGATGSPWMGLEVHARFRTLIVQAENGPFRLKQEFSEIREGAGVDLNDWLRVNYPGRHGLPLHEPAFRREMREMIRIFTPGVVAFDPWNRIVHDDKQKDYRAAIDWLMDLLPEEIEERPALVVVCHLRKRSGGEGRKRGRDLLPELSGSGMIGSAARSVFILEPASPDPADNRVVWTVAKNNDGHEGASSAWLRRNGLFDRFEEFDFDEFFSGADMGREKITADKIRDMIGSGILKKKAAKRLQEITGCGQSAAYAALSPKGRFGHLFDETPEGLLVWTGGK
jgi:hypothetical protein